MGWGNSRPQANQQRELCFEAHGGQRCTLPKGHSGDHIASSVSQSNIIGTWREDDSDERQ